MCNFQIPVLPFHKGERRKALIPVLFFISVASSEMISDFAPMTVGSKWQYSYSCDKTYIGAFISKDSLTISLELLSKELQGNDTMVLLRIMENGRTSGSSMLSTGLPYDSAVNSLFIDTVIISKDSISAKAGYLCKVFPFWRSHEIVKDSLHLGYSSSDSVYYFKTTGWVVPNTTASTYLRGVGLYDFSSFGGIHLVSNTVISLISHNGKTITLGSINDFLKPIRRTTNTSIKYKRLLIYLHTAKHTSPVFSLNGKRIYTNTILLKV